MLTWIPWVWIKLITLAVILVALASVLVLYIIVRPRPVAPLRDWAKDWNELSTHDESADARDLYYQASTLYDQIVDDWTSSIASKAHGFDDIATTELLESFRYGEWGHEAHLLGTEWHSHLSKVISLCTEAATKSGYDWSIQQRLPKTSFDIDEMSREMLIDPLMPADRVLGSALLADMRIASNSGETIQAISAFDAALALADHVGSGQALIHKISGAARRRQVISHAAKIALTQEANAEIIEGFLRVLDQRAAPPLDVDALLAAEQLIGELSIWQIYMEAQEASARDVLLSGIGALIDPEAEDNPTLWTLRRLHFQSMIEFNDLYQMRSRQLWELSPEHFASAPKEPVYSPAPELFQNDFMSDPVFRIRRSFARYEIEDHSDRVLLQIALYIAENGTPPTRLEELANPEDLRIPHHSQTYVYEISHEPPGFSLRLPSSDVIGFLETEFDRSENIPFAGSERATLFRPITDDMFLTDWPKEP